MLENVVDDRQKVTEWIPPGFIFEFGFLVKATFESKLVSFTVCQIGDQIFASLNASFKTSLFTSVNLPRPE